MKLRLLPKLILLILVPVFSIFFLMTSISYLRAVDGLRAQIDADMRSLLEQQGQEYIRFHNNMTVAAEMFSRRRDVVGALATGNETEAVPVVAELLQQYPLIGLVELLKTDGSVFFSQGSVKAFMDYTNSDFLRKMKDNQQAFAVFRKKDSQGMLACVGAPVLREGTLVGYAILSMPMEALGAQYSDRIRVGTSGKCFVLDNKGVVLLDPTDKASLGVDISDIPWVRALLDNPKGVIHYEWNGVAKTCYYEHVKGLDWVVALGFTDDDLLAPMHTMRNASVLLSFFALILLAGIVFWIARSITRPLRSTASFVAEVGKGNMQISETLFEEQRQICHRADEIGTLAQGTLSMQQHLVEILAAAEQSAQKANGAAEEARAATLQAEDALLKAESARREGVLAVTSQLEGIAHTLAVSATDLSSRVEQAEHGSTEQAGRVAQTVMAMQEMNGAVLAVAKNAGIASEVTANTRRKAEDGADVVRQAMESIKAVQKKSLDLKHDMASLGEYAHSISQVMGVISDIADQTNLLALNAAIEAARAGDAGRGFAVVADEVRKLAEKTMLSTTDVGNAIRAIQQSATQNIAQVDEAVQNIAEATELAALSGNALQEIVSMVDSAADQVRGIASASEQQSASSEEISRSIDMVNTIAEENALAMQQAASSVEGLAAQTRQLSALIAEMKNE